MFLPPNRPLVPYVISSPLGNANLWAGLVGYWKFDEGSGSSVGDSSGNGNTGTWQGTLGGQWTTGKFGNAGNFNGTDNYVNMGNPSALNITGSAITLAGWIKISAHAGFGGVFGKENHVFTTSDYGMLFDSATDKILWHCRTSNATSTTIDTTSNLKDNSWHHVAGIYDGSNLAIYVDGAFQASTPLIGTLQNSTTQFQIGKYDVDTRFITGLIDDVRVYNRALSAAEITQLYNLVP